MSHKFTAKLFDIRDNEFHFTTSDNVKVVIVVEENMQDMLEAECLKRKKLKATLP